MSKACDAKYEQLLDESGHWIVRLHSDSVSHGTQVAFSKWINQSQLHVSAFDEMFSTWQEMGKVQFVRKYAQSNYLDNHVSR